jgi:AcrB/AcrD/AcrF family protein
MHWVEKPGTSLEAMRRITVRASKELRAIPGVRNFGSHIGRAEVADEVVGPNFTELWISIEPDADYSPTVHKIQEVVDGYAGLYRDVLIYLKERIKEILTGASATVVVRLYGPDLAVLRARAKEAAALMEKIPGVTTLKVEPQILVPQVTVRLKKAKRWARFIATRSPSMSRSGEVTPSEPTFRRWSNCSSTRRTEQRCRSRMWQKLRSHLHPTKSNTKALRGVWMSPATPPVATSAVWRVKFNSRWRHFPFPPVTIRSFWANTRAWIERSGIREFVDKTPPPWVALRFTQATCCANPLYAG